MKTILILSLFDCFLVEVVVVGTYRLKKTDRNTMHLKTDRKPILLRQIHKKTQMIVSLIAIIDDVVVNASYSYCRKLSSFLPITEKTLFGNA